MNDDRFEPIELLAADGARAVTYRHGAHVVSWTPAGDEERLFLSARSELRAGAAIRGGIPVIFPQFAAQGPLPKHGFARTSEWKLVEAPHAVNGRAATRLRLVDDDATRAVWPHAFAADLAVSSSGSTLEVALEVTNTGAAPFAFTGALHTYLCVADVREAALLGLSGARYRDAEAGGAERVQEEAELRITGAVDRIYSRAGSPVVLRDHERSLLIEADGFPDVVVWNPGPTAGAALRDLEPDGYLRFVCVEAAIAVTPVVVMPAERWEGRQRLTAR